MAATSTRSVRERALAIVALVVAGAAASRLAERRSPPMFAARAVRFPKAGDHMNDGAGFPASRHRVATIVHRILQGEKPAAVPVDRRTRFAHSMKVRTAARMGPVLPPTRLVQTDPVLR